MILLIIFVLFSFKFLYYDLYPSVDIRYMNIVNSDYFYYLGKEKIT